MTAPEGSVTQNVANMTMIGDTALKTKTQAFNAVGNLGNVTEPRHVEQLRPLDHLHLCNEGLNFAG